MTLDTQVAPGDLERETSKAITKPTRIELNWSLDIKLPFELKVTEVGQNIQARPKKDDCLLKWNTVYIRSRIFQHNSQNIQDLF